MTTDEKSDQTPDPWQAVRRMCGAMPYAGSVGMGTGTVGSSSIVDHESLNRWLEGLREALNYQNERYALQEKELDAARRVINAGRTALAVLSQPPGSPIGTHPIPAPAAPRQVVVQFTPTTAGTFADVVAAVVREHPEGIGTAAIAEHIEDANGGWPAMATLLFRTLDQLCDDGAIWQQGARGLYFPERVDCPDCETEGVNCLAHREDSVGRIARSGR